MQSFRGFRMRLILVGFVAALVLINGRAKADFTFGEPVNLKSVIPVIDPARDFVDCVSYNGLEMYIDRLQPGGQVDLDICVLRRASKDEDWGPPENLGPIVNTTSEDATACISADGLSLYFQSNRPEGYGRLDLYSTTRASTSEAWGPPENLGLQLNSDRSEAWPWITADGLTLYFHAYDRTDGYGRADIYVARRATQDAAWGQAVALGPAVNTTVYNESGACPSPDERLLFFSDDNTAPFRPGGYGGGDIWMTRRAGPSDPWQVPANLGPKVNGLVSDFAPRISPDRCMLYFGVLGNNTYDNWRVPIIPVVDFDGDGVIDIKDLIVLIECWGQSNPTCDIGPMPWGDGVVDRTDVEILMSYYGQEIEDPTLMAHWKFDEIAGDIAVDSAADHDASVTPEARWQPEGGMVDGALQLDGVGDYVSAPFVVDPADGPFSAFAWIKGGAPGQVIVSQADGDDWLLADVSTGRLMTTLQKPRGRTPVPPLVSEAVVTDGRWHRVGLVWDGTDRILYVDDIEVARDTQAAPAESTEGLYIGCGKEKEAGTFFYGLIDDVRIYNRTLRP
jgi:hypothetical protein